MATDQTASMQRADLTPGLRQRLRAWIAAPMSRTTRGLLAFGGVILPLLWHAVVGTVASPSWQSGELHDMLAYVFTPRAGFFLYPMLLYSMISLAAYLIDEKNCGKQFFIRLGIWSGSAVMLWYCAVFAVTIGRIEPANPATLFTPLIVGAMPIKPPACYVATAAARGHRRWVKSFVRPDDPAGLAVNRQLQVLKAFEFLLCAISPSGHRLLRRVYDSAGPPLAKRIRNPWLADAAYVTLKPVEWFAAAVLWCWLGRERYLVGTLFRGRKK